jgi:hypothetical protein
LITTGAWFIIMITPASKFWFQTVSALPPNLSTIAQIGIWITLPMPALAALQSWYQGAILHSRKTRGITEAVVIYLFFNILTLVLGVLWGQMIGLYVGLASFVLSTFIQTVWLWVRSKNAIYRVHQRDSMEVSFPPVEIAS